MSKANTPRVCIIGAGMSGMLMAIKLLQTNRLNFTIYERSHKVGGTWRENRYPGVACDVASFSYCYDFEYNPNWTHRFSGGGEIQQYFEGVAEKYKLADWIQFNTEVVEARYQDGKWLVTTACGKQEAFDVFVAATGPLNKKNYPEIRGINDYQGVMCHTADWADDFDYSGKRAAVIGSGSSSVQLISPVSEKASHLTIFQRTPQWVMATPNPEYSKFQVSLKNTFPAVGHMTRHFYLWVGDQFGKAALKDGLRRKFVQWICEAGLKHHIKDEGLRKKITPTDLAMCRRMIMSGSYFPALNRDNTHVETTGISHIEEKGVVTTDGKLHELDLLILATGFEPNAWNVHKVVGENGKTLEQTWDGDKVRTFKSITIPNFPNYFMLIGPNSPITNLSLVEIADIGCDYIMQCIERIENGELTAIVPKEEVTAAFNDEVNNSFEGTIWISGCNSWYLDADGLPQTWPWAPKVYRDELAVLDLNDYDIIPA
jgi:cation diffusion facilitator CzcD-associated flavoprotein CzcO